MSDNLKNIVHDVKKIVDENESLKYRLSVLKKQLAIMILNSCDKTGKIKEIDFPDFLADCDWDKVDIAISYSSCSVIAYDNFNPTLIKSFSELPKLSSKKQ